MALVRFTRRQPRVSFPAFSGASFPNLDDVENRMNRFMERVLTDPFGAVALPETIGWIPAMDVAETTAELTLTAELPGIDPKDVDVSVEDGVLTIRGEKSEEKEEEKKKVYLYERSYGSFQRSFALPAGINSSKIEAEFGKGLLKVRIPKDGNAKPDGRKVAIKTV